MVKAWEVGQRADFFLVSLKKGGTITKGVPQYSLMVPSWSWLTFPQHLDSLNEFQFTSFYANSFSFYFLGFSFSFPFFFFVFSSNLSSLECFMYDGFALTTRIGLLGLLFFMLRDLVVLHAQSQYAFFL